jgi:hypothetical protein
MTTEQKKHWENRLWSAAGIIVLFVILKVQFSMQEKVDFKKDTNSSIEQLKLNKVNKDDFDKSQLKQDIVIEGKAESKVVEMLSSKMDNIYFAIISQKIHAENSLPKRNYFSLPVIVPSDSFTLFAAKRDHKIKIDSNKIAFDVKPKRKFLFFNIN